MKKELNCKTYLKDIVIIGIFSGLSRMFRECSEPAIQAGRNLAIFEPTLIIKSLSG